MVVFSILCLKLTSNTSFYPQLYDLFQNYPQVCLFVIIKLTWWKVSEKCELLQRPMACLWVKRLPWSLLSCPRTHPSFNQSPRSSLLQTQLTLWDTIQYGSLERTSSSVEDRRDSSLMLWDSSYVIPATIDLDKTGDYLAPPQNTSTFGLTVHILHCTYKQTFNSQRGFCFLSLWSHLSLKHEVLHLYGFRQVL